MGIDRDAFFREFTLRACGELELQPALERVHAYLRYAMPADALVLIDGDRPVARAGDHGILGGRDGIAVGVAGLLVGRPDAPSDVVRIGGHDDLGAEALEALGGGSALGLRFEVDGRRAGLWVVAEDRQAHTEDDASLLGSIREPIAIALRMSRRLQALARGGPLAEADLPGVVVGAETGLRDVMAQVQRLAPLRGPVLLLGETGTGKGVIARAIHRASGRATGPFVAVRCGAVPEVGLDAVLFGTALEPGLLELAQGGTLFLDEVGALEREAQDRLVELLGQHQMARRDGTDARSVDVRVIASTRRDLEAQVRADHFREDLWYQLAVLPLRVPPLRLRREDLPALVQHFVRSKASELSLHPVPQLPPTELDRLQAYDWPGNVRELENLVERAVILARESVLRFPVLRPARGSEAADQGVSADPPRTMAEAQRAHIQYVLARTGGQVAGPGGAAEILDMNPSTLRSRMKRLGMAM